MTRAELLEFMEKSGLLRSLPPETQPERIREAIKKADQTALPAIEKTIKDLYEQQKHFQEQIRGLERRITVLLKKAKKLTAAHAEVEEEAKEEKMSEKLLKEL